MSEEINENYEMSPENFRLFYQIQYDRIDKLETKRENLCNFVLTLSSAIIIFSLSNENRLVNYTNYLIVLVCIINLAAIAFIRATRPFIKMHQKRAKLASKYNAASFNNIKKEAGKLDSDGYFFNRSNVYTYLHFTIFFIMLVLLAQENQWFCCCKK